MRNLSLVVATTAILWVIAGFIQHVSCAEPVASPAKLPAGVERIVLGPDDNGDECHALEWSLDGTKIGGVAGHKLLVWSVAEKKPLVLVELDASVVTPKLPS